MAKKKNFVIDNDGFEEEAVQGSSGSGKLPIDSTGAGHALQGFQEIPVTMLHPFTLKNGNDYSRHNKTLTDLFVDSIKNFGVLDTLIVRPSHKTMGMYEIVAGESRWEHAKQAGLETVPCRIMDFSDEQAKEVFNITNLMRRDLTPRDRINGWYSFYMEIKEKGTAIGDLERVVAEEQQGIMTMVGGKGLSLRSIQRYVKMHDLIEDWIVRLDEGKVTGVTAYQIAFFPPAIQDELLAYKVTESKVKWLREIYEGNNKKVVWSDRIIPDNLEPLPAPTESEEPKENPAPVKLTKEEKAQRKQERAYKKAFKAVTPKLLDAAWEHLQKDDYEKADEVIVAALQLYYEQKET